MNLTETALGFEIRLPHYTLLMGGINAQFSAIKAAYPDIQFTRIKQVHGDVVVESENAALDYQIPADGHFSRAANLGLCVITADCMPIFLIDPVSEIIAGVHAGWRGVAGAIVPKAIAKLHALGSSNRELHVFIGPHIQKANFEVGYDVRDQLLASIGHAAGEPFSTDLGHGKALVDLDQIMKEQLLQQNVPPENVHTLYLNTFTNPLFHSHRRDQEKAGRQISFIFRHG